MKNVTPSLCLMWANCRVREAVCAVCGQTLESEQGPCVVLRGDGATGAAVCDTCAGKVNQGIALLSVRDRFNESLSADPRPLDNIGRTIPNNATPETGRKVETR